ncbi:MAG: TetR/AcrR family transcriptional regulator [Faecalibacterium sp.]
MEEKTYHHGNLREAMIEAGIAIISKEGAAQLSLRKVAAHCGVSHAAPYKHFENKEALLSAMKTHIADGVAAHLQASILLDGTDEEKLLSFGKSYVRYFVEHPSYYRFLFMQSDYQMTIQKDGIYCDDFELFSSFIGIAGNLMNSSGEALALNIITMLAVVNGLIGLFISDNIKMDVDYNKIVDKILQERLKF